MVISPLHDIMGKVKPQENRSVGPGGDGREKMLIEKYKRFWGDERLYILTVMVGT